jgi:hypothetical protein
VPVKLEIKLKIIEYLGSEIARSAAANASGEETYIAVVN